MQKLKIINDSNGKELILGNSKPYILEYVESAANNSANIYSSAGGQDGISIDEVTLKEKLIPITGGIKAQNREDLDKRRAFLSSFLNPKEKFTLIYSNNAHTRRIRGRILDTTFQKPISTTQKFLIQILCPKPYWEEIEEHKLEIALWVGDFGFPLEITEEGIQMGHRESNLIVNINNNGNVPTGIRIQIRALATVVNPSFFNINTREYIKINRTLSAGDVLEIITEIDNTSIELLKNNGIREDVFNWLDLESEFLQLAVGDNLFRYDAEEGIDNLEVSVYNTSLYLGV